MSCPTCKAWPCTCLPCSFTVASPQQFAGSLAKMLVPCIDHIRNLNTCLGTRPYRVALVRTRWSGGQRGRGVEEVLNEEFILPTPLVEGLGDLDEQQIGPGREEFGAIKVSEISARYTEDHLLGRDEDGSRRPPEENFYWEVHLMTATGYGPRKRFQVAGLPELSMTNVQWIVTLVRASEDRTRQMGQPKS